MEINRDNYESFLVDYLDGTLSQSQKELVEEFLLLNPEIKDEISDLDDIVLMPEKEDSVNLENLKKQSEENKEILSDFEYLCIAKLEKDLTDEETLLLQERLSSDKAFRKGYETIQLLKLKPSLSVTYQEKRHLKRYVIPVISHLRAQHVVAVAVVVFLVFGLFFIRDSNRLPDYPTHPKANVVDLESLGIPMALPEVDRTKIAEGIVKTSPLPLPKIEKRVEAEILREETELDIKSEDINFPQLQTIKPIPFTFKESALGTFQASLPPALHKDYYPENSETPSGTTREIGPFELLQYGFKRLAQAADIDIDGQRNSQGKLTRIRIESNLFALSLPIKRED